MTFLNNHQIPVRGDRINEIPPPCLKRIPSSDVKDIIKELRDGFSLFLTSAMSIMVSTLGVFLLGIYAAAYDVGIYTAMQKIPNVLITCFTPISQVLFPYISTLFQNNRIKAKKILKIIYK